MKNFKKIASAIAALSLAACVAVPMSATVFTASAAKITFSNEKGATHNYEYYKIFTGDAESSGMNTEKGATLTNVKWADETKGGNLLTALKGDTTFGKEGSNLFKDCTTAQNVADVLGSGDFTADMAKKFAELAVSSFAESVQTMTKGDDGKYEIADDGYYVIAETSDAIEDGAKTLYLLGVVDGQATTDINVTVKASAPTVVKKVKEDDKTATDANNLVGSYDNHYNDVADYSIGEDVPFVLQATLPSTLDDYKTYYMEFTDHLDKGFEQPTSFTLTIGAADKTYTFTKGDTGYTCSDVSDGNIEVTVEPTSDNGDKNGWDITIKIKNVKQYNVAGTDDTKTADKDESKVTVDYTASLDEDAVIGRPGNYNDVYLTYSNNPNNTGDGDSDGTPDETGETDKDGVVVFTYELDLNKYDSTDEATKTTIAGAKFKIKNNDGKYLKIDGGEYSWVTLDTDATVFESETGKNIEIKGLDAGTYFVTEIEAPPTYNKIEGDIEFTITATTANDNKQDEIGPAEVDARTGEKQLTKVELKHKNPGATDEETDETKADGSGAVKSNIANSKGATLPSTGGIGTTLFYLGGGALVAVAGVMLITKKRMTKE